MVFGPCTDRDGAVYLVGGNMDNPLDIVSERCLEYLLGAKDVGLDEIDSADDRPVNVGLRREIDQDVVTRQRGVQVRGRADVAAHKTVARAIGNWRQVGQVAGISQLVEHGDFGANERWVGIREQLSNVLRADEAGPTGDEHAHSPQRPSFGSVSATT